SPCPPSRLKAMPTAPRIRSRVPTPRCSRANIRIEPSRAASGTICPRKRRRPLRKPSSTSPKFDRHEGPADWQIAVRRSPLHLIPLEEDHDMSEPEKQHSASAPGKVVYTAKTHTTGGRENGVARSSDGRLDVKLSLPGSPRIGTNPEQLFAAGWSACFEGAIGVAAHKKKIKLPADVAIDAEVDLHLDDGEYFLSARLNVSIPGIERSIAQDLVDDAKGTCPYSKATRGNIAVTYN